MCNAPRLYRQSPRQGVAAVEFAIVSPLLTIFVFAIIEITGAIYLQQSLTIAAYEGARVALLPGTSSGNIEAASNRILESRRIKGAEISVIPADFQTVAFGDPIRVEVSAPAATNILFHRFLGAGKTLTASVTMMSEK